MKNSAENHFMKNVHLHFIFPRLYWISIYLKWLTFFTTLHCLEIILLLDNGKLLQFFHEIFKHNMNIFLNTSE